MKQVWQLTRPWLKEMLIYYNNTKCVNFQGKLLFQSGEATFKQSKTITN